MEQPVVLAVDGNSLVHRGYHALAHTGMRSLAGDPVWAVRGLLMQLVHAVERVMPSSVVVGFDDPERSQRREAYPAYKAQRPDKLRTLVSQLSLAADVLTSMGVAVEVPAGLEADDVLASVAARTRETGGRTVVVTSDRDAFALIDDHTSVLRVINGGVEASPLLTPERLEIMLGVRPDQYRDFAALRGDPSDNLPGVYGVGPKIAARLLADHGTAQTAFAAGAHPRLAAPEAHENWARNCELMAMRTDLVVGTGSRLPLAVEAVRKAYAFCRLPGTQAQALRALCDVEPPAAAPPPDALNWDPTAEWRARRSHPPLPQREAEPRRESQLTLF
ncbi:hypothetical protein D9V37_08810 [Nocardioides mangrovicus]|uniref:5'-3' exonuclease n=1 Tax=Nocardioides mangrovicus TaxID=2478913 RepID=A0A3L8P4F3_9ACTN|nr:5'-3' exonuclease H3TH domain-containing protein [Nocardioides mangrovicus]RLV49964.1 hypothetical protein D9V37_08810 [Nocardioides mangrovicus]